MDNRSRYYYFIDYLRAAGMFLVAWPHLTENLNPSWISLNIIQWLFNRPLAIIQNFGALGVSLFFVITGFLMGEASNRSRKRAAWMFAEKTIRILAPIWIGMFTFFLLIQLLNLIGLQSYWTQFTLSDWVKSVTLSNLVFGIPERINGVLWFIVPYMICIFFETIYRCIWKNASIKFVLLSVVVISICYMLDRYLPKQVCANLIYVPIMLIGYLISLRKQNKSKTAVSISFIVCYVLLVTGFYQFSPNYYENEPYILSVVLAALIFSICLMTDSQRHPPKIIAFFSSISFSFYIVHSLYGGLIISAMFPFMPYSICLLCGITASVLAAYGNYRLAERPIKRGLSIYRGDWISDE